MRACKIVAQYSPCRQPDSFPLTAWKQSIDFMERQARRPNLNFAKAFFFRLCPTEVAHFRLSFCKSFKSEARNNLAQPLKVDAFERVRNKAFHHRFHASQHRMSVQRSLFLYARNAVEAINNLASKLPGNLCRKCVFKV